MSSDFTFEMYDDLLNAGLNAGYAHLTVREYLSDERLPERFIIHRHDVDRKPERAVEMAHIEAERDVSSTYYVRSIEKTFRPELIRTIEAFGHEVGYHYEDVDWAHGDLVAAHESFADTLERFREICTVETVCMHGNPLTPHVNSSMWDEGPEYDAYDLLGEAYLSMDFDDVVYFSDTNRTWLDIPEPPGEKHVRASTTEDLIELITDGRFERACILTHPNRWTGTYLELVAERTKDFAINVVKRGSNIAMQRR